MNYIDSAYASLVACCEDFANAISTEEIDISGMTTRLTLAQTRVLLQQSVHLANNQGIDPIQIATLLELDESLIQALLKQKTKSPTGNVVRLYVKPDS